MTAPDRVVVVGGGISGLTAALELAERGVATTVVEAATRFGGKIETSRIDGLVVEAGADSFLSAKPAALALCQRLGLGDRLINSKPEDRRTFVWSRGRLRELPEGLILGSPARAGSLLRSGLLSPRGAARMVADVAVPRRRDGGDESLASFFTRRLGPEAYARVVEPLLAGIHAGDATQLSLEATFPRFAEMERRHGGLVRATLAARRGGDTGVSPAAATPAGRTPFVSLSTGLAELVEALVARLGSLGVDLRLGHPVRRLRSAPDGYQVEVGGAAIPAAAVILATPAPVTARLVRHLCPPAAGVLESIRHASTATVSLAYRTEDIGQAPAGYGFVVPRAEGRDLIAATWSSSKWPDRAPGGRILVRGYVGGVGREAVLGRDDQGLVDRVRAELGALAGIDGEPVHAEVHRFVDGMPQYTLGHRERVENIRAAVAGWPGLAVTGAAYSGVGIPDCVADATATATAVLDGLPGLLGRTGSPGR